MTNPLPKSRKLKNFKARYWVCTAQPTLQYYDDEGLYFIGVGTNPNTVKYFWDQIWMEARDNHNTENMILHNRLMKGHQKRMTIHTKEGFETKAEALEEMYNLKRQYPAAVIMDCTDKNNLQPIMDSRIKYILERNQLHKEMGLK